MKTQHGYKLLLLDLDGTTVESRGDALPSEKVKTAIKMAQKNVAVSVATGRGYYFAKDIIDELGLTGPGVFSGGAEIVKMESGETINRQLISIDKMHEAIKIMLPFGYEILSDVHNYEKGIWGVDEVTTDAVKLIAIDVSIVNARHMLDELSGVIGVTAHMTTSWNRDDMVCVEVTQDKADKRHGAERLINMLGFKKQQVIAIGDGYNDLPLLEAAGLKIVMGNAPDELKALADYVTPSIDEDGVAVAIEKFILC